MRPGEVFAGDYFTGNVQLVIPRYQRPYEWGTNRWTDLWRDICRSFVLNEKHAASGAKGTIPHFMGPVILEADGALPGGTAQRRLVVDGQQRLLTFFVLAAAIRDHHALLNNLEVKRDNELAVIIPKYQTGVVQRFEVEKSYQSTYDSIASGECVASIPEALMNDQLALAYQFFRYQLWLGRDAMDTYDPALPPRPGRAKNSPPPGSYEGWGDPAVPRPIDLGLLESVMNTGLKFLEIVLDSTDEEASVVFETMNSKNTPLRQFDHLRNSIFVCMPTRRDAFHASHWSRVEQVLSNITYSSLRNTPEEQFFYEYMISLGEERVTLKSLHRSFMERVYEALGYPPKDEARFEKKYALPISQAALLYPIALGQATTTSVFGRTVTVSDANRQLLAELLAMSGGPPVPIALRFLMRMLDGSLTNDELAVALKDVQSFLVRQMLSGATLSPLRSQFMQVSMNMESTSLEDLRASLHKAGWKSDADVLGRVAQVELYNYGGAVVFPILRGIEKQLAGNGAHPLPYGTGASEYSIEHIFPQSKKTPKAWIQDLAEWKPQTAPEAMLDRTHCLGNLTAVTNYDNSRNGRKRFEEKVRIVRSVAPIRTNDSFLTAPRWTIRQIDARTELLAKTALKHWPVH